MTRRSSSRPAQRAALVVGGVCAALLIGEGVARSIQTSFELANFDLAGEGNRPGCVRPSVTRGYEPIPGMCGVNQNSAREYHEPDDLPESPRPLRVMVVGDSISTQTVWPGDLTTALSRGWQDRAVALQTFGVPGYNTCQELTMYLEKVESFDPDVVLLQACANDARGSPVLLKNDGRARYYMGDEVVEFPSFLLHSRLSTLLVLGFAPRTPATELGSGPDRTRDCLGQLREEVTSSGRPLLSVLFPLFWERAEAPGAMIGDEDQMRSLLLDSQIPFLDLRPAYEAAGPMKEHRDTPTDFIHASAKGQRVAAAAIGEWVAKSLPEPGAP